MAPKPSITLLSCYFGFNRSPLMLCSHMFALMSIATIVDYKISFQCNLPVHNIIHQKKSDFRRVKVSTLM
jgi:hypothetical protein